MTAPSALVEELVAAREELLAAVEGISQDAFVQRPPGEPQGEDERWPVCDVLWHVGLYEDFVRRWVDGTRRGVVVQSFVPRRRPAYLNTPALLHAWLDQTRRPTTVLIEKLSESELDAPRASASGGETTFALALSALAAHDRAHARQVLALRSAAEPPSDPRDRDS